MDAVVALLNTLKSAAGIFSQLTWVAIGLGIFVMQVVKEYDERFLKRNMDKGETVVVGIMLSGVVFLSLFAVYSWWAMIPMRNEAWAKAAAMNAALSGIGSVLIVYSVKKFTGFDLDDVFGGGKPTDQPIAGGQ